MLHIIILIEPLSLKRIKYDKNTEKDLKPKRYTVAVVQFQVLEFKRT